ncbi:BON domain-containing protein [Paraburkholderia sp. J94]|uniref:BON domain-containing protein n=1 Tax=Paraburkholderia sp. J94 TaxID=2805441 RepID=UPI002AB19AD2|nr:BON domain-containing protein [Paraburkholderia sp. J94]
MKLSHPFSCFAVVAIFAATSGHALAQSAQSTQSASSSAATPLAASNTKAVRAANRKLAHRVENALARTRGLNSARIIVTARDGRITLSGAVNYNEQIPLATDAARKVEGVTDVENRIRATGASL